MGLTREDMGDGIEVWPENEGATGAFIAMQTQWRAGMGGATGLDYNAIPSVLRLTGVVRGDWSDTFECLRIMESEAMKVMNEARHE